MTDDLVTRLGESACFASPVVQEAQARLTALLATSAEKDAEIARLTSERAALAEAAANFWTAVDRAEAAEAEAAALREHSHQRGEDIRKLSAEAAALRERLETAERALLEVVGATRAYLPPDGISAQECLNRILAATDNPKITPIITAMERTNVNA